MTQLKWYDVLYGEGADWGAFLEEDLARMLSFHGLKSRTRGILLDVGCGAGGLLAKAREMGVSRVVGLDLSASALQRAKKHLRDADFIVADGLSPRSEMKHLTP